MNPPDEIRHLQMGPAPGEKPSSLFLVNFTAVCRDNAQAVLARAKEVLEIVVQQDPNNWPSDRAWQDLLPRWFIAQCAPEGTPEENERLVRWERQLSFEERAQYVKTVKWTVLDWVYWFESEMRDWYWWDATVPNPDTVIVVVEAEDVPFAWGSLDWLLRASGAVTVDNDLP